MNKVMRGFTMSGLAIAAGLVVSAGPAAASSAAPQPAAKAPAAAQSGAKAKFRDGRIVGYYRGPISCERAGRSGEWRDQWEDHDCFPIRGGFRRGSWALKVYYGWAGPQGGHGGHGGPHGGPGGHGGHGPGGHGPGHGPWKKN
ncbi:hypothetical protein [Actinoplanes palleronii]|uniref:Uncharacterized protein n=1 Tax=Actinoplanes palleronii TaxID=113570 RepID=A0ABQ4BML4_9ACTN|nr:hypothetical protein [Actinoplanes palleronii]GIE71927.1 hypothetical protein Apa02nite_080350 [Actinoplanes palleronii]